MASSDASGSKERRLSSQYNQSFSLQFLPPFLRDLGMKKGEQSPWASPSTPIYHKSDISESTSGLSSSQNDTSQLSGLSSDQNDQEHPLVDVDTQDENASVASMLGVTGALEPDEDEFAPLLRRSTPGVRVRESSLERATHYGVPLTRPFRPVQLASAFRWGPPAYRPLQEQIMHMRSSTPDSWKFRAVFRVNSNPSYMHYLTIDKLGSDAAITERARGRLMFQRDLITFLVHLGVRITRDPMTYIEEDFATNYVTCNFKYWKEDPGNMYAEEAFYYMYRTKFRMARDFWSWFTGVNVEVKDEGISSAMTFPEPDYFFGSLHFVPNARGSCWRCLFDGPIYGDHQDWPTVSMVQSLAREYPLSQKSIFRAINTGGNKVHIFLDGNNTAEEVLGMFEPGAKIGGKEDDEDSEGESDIGYAKVVDADTAAAARQLLGMSFGPKSSPSSRTRPRRKVKQATTMKEPTGNILEQLVRFKDSKIKTHLILRPADTIDVKPFISDLDLPIYNTTMAAVLHTRGYLAFNADIHSLLAKIGSSMYGEPQDYILSNTIMTFMAKVCEKGSTNLQPYHSFIFGHNYAASIQFRELFWTWFTGVGTTLSYSPEGWAQFEFFGVVLDGLLLENFESHHNGECWRLLFQGPVKSQGPEHASRFLTKHNILVLNEDHKYASRNDLALTKDGHFVHVRVGGHLTPEQIVDMLDFRDVVGGYYHSPRNVLLSYFVNQSDNYKRTSRLAPFFKWLGGFPPSYPDNTALCVKIKVSELETALYGYETLTKFLYCESMDKTAIYLPDNTRRWRLSFSWTEPIMQGLQERGERLQISYQRFCFLTVSVIAWLIVLLDIPTPAEGHSQQMSFYRDEDDIMCDLTFAQQPFWTLSLHRPQQPFIIAKQVSGNWERSSTCEPSGRPVATWEKVKPPDRLL